MEDYTMDELLNGELDADADEEALNPKGFKEYPPMEAQRLFGEITREHENINNRLAQAIQSLTEKVDRLEETMKEGDKLEEETRKMWKRFIK